MTYYDILQVTENASDEVIHMAYKALAKRYHPDLFCGDPKIAEEKMKQINTAFEVLSNKQKRSQYDFFLHNEKNNSQTNRQQDAESRSTTNNPPRSKRESVFPSSKKSGWIIGILLILSYIQVWHPYAESDYYDYSFYLGLIDFCFLSIIMMIIPIFVGILKNFSLHGVKILCTTNSIAIYVTSLILYICELIPAMLIGWILPIFYYFINKHILLQIKHYECSKKRAFTTSFLILLIFVLTFVSCKYSLKNIFNENNSTTQLPPYFDDKSENNSTNNTVDTTPKKDVKWMSERDLFYYEDYGKYVLVFKLADEDKTAITSHGTVEIRIVNDDNVIVYNKTHSFTESNFQKWTYNKTTEKFLASIYISPSDITSGTSSNGEVYFTVCGDDYSFEESTLKIYDLPLKPITIQLPSLPLTINNYGYSSDIQTTLRIDSITYDKSNEDSIYIYFSGEKIYDIDGNNSDSWISFDWKLYDSENYLIDHGTFYTDSIAVGDKFKNKGIFVTNGIKAGESFKLVIIGDNDNNLNSSVPESPTVQPTCATYSCNNTVSGNGIYCSEHKCANINCNYKKYNNSQYCSVCQCSEIGCENPKIESGYRCEEHSCKVVGCTSEKLYSSDYCITHKCSSCDNPKIDMGSYCINHTCNTTGCTTNKQYGSEYCMSHTCLAGLCKNETITGGKYCEEHTCIVAGCMKQKLLDDYCYSHSD